MKKFKRGYCVATLIFALFTLALTMFSLAPTRASAAAQDAETISQYLGEPNVERNQEGVDAANDINDGFSIVYNNGEGTLSGALKILIVLTVITLAPSLLIMLTSFTRIIIVLHFLRTALGTQTAPPNQVLIGLALFLTLFIMAPIFSKINTEAIQPFDEGEITQTEAIQIGLEPIREFMYEQTQRKDLLMFCDIADVDYDIDNLDNISITVLVPAFIVSELRSAFIMGFLLYVPFIVIDMVVASVLMSMGMMMLPPTTISMPFKILLFILADGWNLVIGNVVKTFY